MGTSDPKHSQLFYGDLNITYSTYNFEKTFKGDLSSKNNQFKNISPITVPLIPCVCLTHTHAYSLYYSNALSLLTVCQ